MLNNVRISFSMLSASQTTRIMSLVLHHTIKLKSAHLFSRKGTVWASLCSASPWVCVEKYPSSCSSEQIGVTKDRSVTLAFNVVSSNFTVCADRGFRQFSRELQNNFSEQIQTFHSDGAGKGIIIPCKLSRMWENKSHLFSKFHSTPLLYCTSNQMAIGFSG